MTVIDVINMKKAKNLWYLLPDCRLFIRSYIFSTSYSISSKTHGFMGSINSCYLYGLEQSAVILRYECGQAAGCILWRTGGILINVLTKQRCAGRVVLTSLKFDGKSVMRFLQGFLDYEY